MKKWKNWEKAMRVVLAATTVIAFACIICQTCWVYSAEISRTDSPAAFESTMAPQRGPLIHEEVRVPEVLTVTRALQGSGVFKWVFIAILVVALIVSIVCAILCTGVEKRSRTVVFDMSKKTTIPQEIDDLCRATGFTNVQTTLSDNGGISTPYYALSLCTPNLSHGIHVIRHVGGEENYIFSHDIGVYRYQDGTDNDVFNPKTATWSISDDHITEITKLLRNYPVSK